MLKFFAFIIAMTTWVQQIFGNQVYVTNYGDTSVSVIDTATNGVIATIPVGSSPIGVTFTPNGTRAYVVNSASNNVSVINMATKTVAMTITGFTIPTGIAISPNGARAYVANNGTIFVTVIDTGTNTISLTITVGNQPFEIAFTPNGTKACVTNSLDGTVSIIDTSSNTVISTITVGLTAEGVVITPDGLHAYVASGNVSVINLNNNAVSTIPLPGVATAAELAITPDGKLVYATSLFGGGTVYIIDTSINTVVGAIFIGAGTLPKEIAITPNGKFAYVANFGTNNTAVIDLSTNTVIATVPVGATPFGVGITPGPTNPANLTGKQVKNNFGTETEWFNQLKWQAGAVSVPVSGYFVYRDGVKIATLSASTFKYEDHNRKKGVTTVYSVAGFDAMGNEGTPSTVVIN